MSGMILHDTTDHKTLKRRLLIEIDDDALANLELTDFQRAVLCTPKEEGKQLSGTLMDLQIIAEAFERQWARAQHPTAPQETAEKEGE